MMYWRAVYEVGRKEFIQQFRSKRLIIAAIVLGTVLALATVVGPYTLLNEIERNEAAFPSDKAYYDEQKEDLAPNNALLFYLGAPLIGGYMFVQLIAILLTADSVCSEWRNRTIFLLLSKPVPRSAFLLGKYLGTVSALSVVVVGLFVVDYSVMQALLPGNGASDWGGFLAALGVIVLGLAAYAGFAAFTSSLTRSTMQSMLLSLGAWLLVFPVVASIGYLSVINDDGFEALGEYDRDGLLAACGYDPTGYYVLHPGDEDAGHLEGYGGDNDTAHQQAVDEYEACKEPFDEEYEAYYVARGSPTRDWRAEWQKCQDLSVKEEQEFRVEHGGEPTAAQWDQFYQDTTRESVLCSVAVSAAEDDWREERERIRLAKYDLPRVDWSRYFSPGASMTVADDLLRDEFSPWDEVGFSLDSMLAGADATPAHKGLGVLSLVVFSCLSVGSAALLVIRRDFE